MTHGEAGAADEDGIARARRVYAIAKRIACVMEHS
jgi:hypothetical protein